MRKLLLSAAIAVTTIGLAAPTAAWANGGSRPFQSAGSGTETPSGSDCQFTAAGCSVETDGTATSSHLGTGSYTSTLTVAWASATSNGAGGYCAPASGTSTLTAANGDTLDQTVNGTVCEVGASAANDAHTFSGTFTNDGGTGRFTSATGGGTITGGDDGAGNSSYSESGTIDY